MKPDILFRMENDEMYLAHFGISGQKWGIRRYQNEDGTLTEAGKQRYGVNSLSELNKNNGNISNFKKDVEESAKAQSKNYDKDVQRINKTVNKELSTPTSKISKMNDRFFKKYGNSDEYTEKFFSLMDKRFNELYDDMATKTYGVNTLNSSSRNRSGSENTGDLYRNETFSERPADKRRGYNI